MMTISVVRERLKRISDCAGDDEIAHGEEDQLYADLLQAIADGSCDDPQACAAEALKTKNMEFVRWCA